MENTKILLTCDIKTEKEAPQNWLEAQNVEVHIESGEDYEWNTSSASADMAENKSYVIVSVNGDLSKDKNFIKTFELNATVYNEKND